MLYEEFKNAEDEMKMMEHLEGESDGRLTVTRPILSSAGAFLKHLKQDDLEDILYFYTHGNTKDPWHRNINESRDYNESCIEFSQGKITPEELLDDIDELPSRPLVILNMCESAQMIPSLSDSFIDFFLNCRALGVMGTECPMTIRFAHPFAQSVFKQIFSGVSIGMALLYARRYFALKCNNPLGLAYTFFGPATLTFSPPVLRPDNEINNITMS